MTDTLSELPSFAARLTPAVRRPAAVRLSSSRTANSDLEDGATGSSLFHPERTAPGRRRAATASQAQQPRSIWNSPDTENAEGASDSGTAAENRTGMSRMGRRRRAISNAVSTRLGWGGGGEEVDPEARRLQEERAHYDRQVVDLLDVIGQ